MGALPGVGGVSSLPMASLWTRAGLTWRQLGLRLWRQIYEDELLGRCAELAYFFLFSIFPLLLFLTTLVGYLAEANPEVRWGLLPLRGPGCRPAAT